MEKTALYNEKQANRAFVEQEINFILVAQGMTNSARGRI